MGLGFGFSSYGFLLLGLGFFRVARGLVWVLGLRLQGLGALCDDAAARVC